MLARLPFLEVSIYYKCPFCMPQSLAVAWARDVLAPSPMLRRQVRSARGVLLLDDAFLASLGPGRVRQVPVYDNIGEAGHDVACQASLLSCS